MLKSGKHSTECLFFSLKFVGRLAMSARGSHKKISGIWHEFENKTCTTNECFPILFHYFVRIPGTVTRTAMGSSIPWFQSVNTFQARKQMSFHR